MAREHQSGYPLTQDGKLLKDTDNSRVDALRSIVDHIRPLDAAGAKDILGPLRGFPRLTALRAISMKLPIDLSGTQAAELLEGTESSRTDAIKSLASHLGPQDAAGINSVLGDLRDFPRLTALRSLADTGRIEHGLSQDDIQQIISGIGSQRSDALTLLLPYTR